MCGVPLDWNKELTLLEQYLNTYCYNPNFQPLFPTGITYLKTQLKYKSSFKTPTSQAYCFLNGWNKALCSSSLGLDCNHPTVSLTTPGTSSNSEKESHSGKGCSPYKRHFKDLDLPREETSTHTWLLVSADFRDIIFEQLFFFCFFVGWRWCTSNLITPYVCSSKRRKMCFYIVTARWRNT